MTDIFEQTLKQLNEITDSASQKVGSFFKKAVNKGEEYAVKGKIQLEIEKLKWELKQKYADLGKYVTDKKEKKSVTDFSHDSHFLELVNEAYKLKNYIEERRVQNRQKIKK